MPPRVRSDAVPARQVPVQDKRAICLLLTICSGVTAPEPRGWLTVAGTEANFPRWMLAG
jgi:hypothetical protein